MNSQIDFERPSDAALTQAEGRSLMATIWRTLRGYILWSYERGSLHYDIMVTLILIFVFLSPRFINYKDKPVVRNPHPIAVVVIPDPQGRLVYQIPANAVNKKQGDLSQQLEGIIEPISGAVSISHYEEVKDSSGRTQSYKVWIDKE